MCFCIRLLILNGFLQSEKNLQKILFFHKKNSKATIKNVLKEKFTYGELRHHQIVFYTVKDFVTECCQFIVADSLYRGLFKFLAVPRRNAWQDNTPIVIDTIETVHCIFQFTCSNCYPWCLSHYKFPTYII